LSPAITELLKKEHPGMANTLRPEHRRVIAVLNLGVFLPLLDLTIVHLAINSLGSIFSASISHCQWVATGYALAAATVIPVCGWASNRFSGKTMWMTGQVVFLIGSVASAAAWSIQSLIAFRVVQGLGGGMLMPVMQTVLVRNVGQANVKPAMAALAVPSVLAPILGPVLGGLILRWASWEWLFLVNVPACMVAIIVAWRYLPQDVGVVGEPLDVRGLLLLSPGLALFVYGITSLGKSASLLDAGTLITLTGGTVLVGSFALHAACTASPLVDIGLFRNRNFNNSAGLLLFSSIAFFGGLVLLPLLFQQVGGFDTVRVGLLLGVQGIGALVSRCFLSSLTTKWGERRVACAAVLLSSAASMVFFFHPSEVPTAVLAVALLLRGAGLGLVTIMALSDAYKGLERDQIAHASTLTRITTQVGASFGTAGLCAALQCLRQASTATDPNGAAFGWTMLCLTVVTLVCFWPISRMGASPRGLGEKLNRPSRRTETSLSST
jgi:EmrB/QacA subfamily drug resistance transporter